MAAPSRKLAALYHRVSTSDQDEQGPLKGLERAARRDGYEQLEIVTETGSGATSDRPGLNRVMALARQRKIGAVYVWKLDRFGRSVVDLMTLLQQLEHKRVRFVSVSQSIELHGDRADPQGRMMLVMLAAVAEFERELIRERTRVGLERARDRGVQLGRPRVELPPQAEVQQLRDEGFTWAAIADVYGCSVWAARQACEKGGGQRPAVSPFKTVLDRRRKAC